MMSIEEISTPIQADPSEIHIYWQISGKAVMVWRGTKSLEISADKKAKHSGDPDAIPLPLNILLTRTFFSGKQMQSCWVPLQDNLKPYTSQTVTQKATNTRIHTNHHTQTHTQILIK